MRNTTPGSDILLALAAGLGPAGRLAKAVDALADAIEGGQLLSSTDPGGLLLTAAERIAELEAEVARLRAALEQVRERTISPPGAEPEREIWRIADAALRWA